MHFSSKYVVILSRKEFQFTHRTYENWFKIFVSCATVLNLAWMIRYSRRRNVNQFFFLQHAALHRIRSVDTTASQPLFYLEDLNGKPDENAYYKEESQFSEVLSLSLSLSLFFSGIEAFTRRPPTKSHFHGEKGCENKVRGRTRRIFVYVCGI